MRCRERGENRDSPLCPPAGDVGAVSRGIAAPRDRVGCPSFRALCVGRKRSGVR
jgi:hypothetical protein